MKNLLARLFITSEVVSVLPTDKMTRKCFVPTCPNAVGCGKTFLYVPKDKEVRQKWCDAVGSKVVSTAELLACEDHFDLAQDAENWQYFKTMGGKLKIKSECLPHKCIESRSTSKKSQISSSAKKRRMAIAARYLRRGRGGRSSAIRKLDLHGTSSATDFSVTSMVSMTSTVNESTLHNTSGEFVESEMTLHISVSSSSPSPKKLRLEPIPGIRPLCSSKEAPGSPVPVGMNLYTTSSPSTSTQQRLEPIPGIRPLCSSKEAPGSSPVPVGMNLYTTSSPSTSTQQRKPATRTQGLTPFSTPFEFGDSPVSTVSSAPSQGSSYHPSSTSSHTSFYSNVDDRNHGCSREMNLIRLDPKFYLGIPPTEYKIVTLLTKHLPVTERDVLLTIKKLKTNDVNLRLAYDFNLSKSQVGKIFNNTLPQLASLLKQFIYWPSADVIWNFLPIQFRRRFHKVQSIIDCFEIEVEKPSNPKHQALTWSEYKKCNSAKVLISCTPHGYINFISRAYGGRITDNKLVTESGYFDKVPSGSAVLADRGFKQLESILSAKNVTLYRPASVSVGTKMTEDEVKDSRRISAVRIHIERVISRIREFRFLDIHSRLDNHLSFLIDDAVIVAAALTNLQDPIIKH